MGRPGPATVALRHRQHNFEKLSSPVAAIVGACAWVQLVGHQHNDGDGKGNLHQMAAGGGQIGLKWGAVGAVWAPGACPPKVEACWLQLRWRLHGAASGSLALSRLPTGEPGKVGPTPVRRLGRRDRRRWRGRRRRPAARGPPLCAPSPVHQNLPASSNSARPRLHLSHREEGDQAARSLACAHHYGA